MNWDTENWKGRNRENEVLMRIVIDGVCYCSGYQAHFKQYRIDIHDHNLYFNMYHDSRGT